MPSARPFVPSLVRRSLQAAVVLAVATQTAACAVVIQRRAPEAPEPPVVPARPLIRSAPLRLPQMATCWSPNCNSRKGADITAIVLHHTASAGDARAIARYFQNPQAQVSSHYVVDRDGTVIRCVPDDKRAWHAGPSHFAGEDNVNDFSIGIEICNRGDGLEPYPPEQVAAVTRLVAHLADRYRIPLGRITRHRDVAIPAGTKIDPSDNFDFEGVVLQAKQLLEDQALWLAQRSERRSAAANGG